MTIEKGLFSLAEFLAWSGIGRTSFYEEINSGRLKAVHFGQKTMIKVEDAYAWRDSLPEYEPGTGKFGRGRDNEPL